MHVWFIYKNVFFLRRLTSLPEVIPFAKYKVSLGVQRGSDFTQATITAATFKTILVPEKIQRFEQKSFGDTFATVGAFPGYHGRAAVQTR